MPARPGGRAGLAGFYRPRQPRPARRPRRDGAEHPGLDVVGGPHRRLHPQAPGARGADPPDRRRAGRGRPHRDGPAAERRRGGRGPAGHVRLRASVGNLHARRRTPLRLRATDTADSWLITLGRFAGTDPGDQQAYDEPAMLTASRTRACPRPRRSAAARPTWTAGCGTGHLARSSSGRATRRCWAASRPPSRPASIDAGPGRAAVTTPAGRAGLRPARCPCGIARSRRPRR